MGSSNGCFANQLRLDPPENDALNQGIVLLSGARLLYGMFGYDEIAKSALGYRVLALLVRLLSVSYVVRPLDILQK